MANHETAATPAGSGSRPWLLQTLTALGVVVAMIFGVRLLLQRAAGGAGGVSNGRLVELLARASIAPKTHILFLRINQRVVVASQTPQGVSALTVLDQPDDVAWVLAQAQAARPLSVSRSFRQMVQRFDSDYTADTEADEHEASQVMLGRTRDGVAGLLGRIRSLKGGGGEGA